MEVLSSRVVVAATDLARSRAFYEEVLGLRVYREYGADGQVLGVVYFLGGGHLELTAGRDLAPAAVALWIQVPLLAAEERRLAAAGASIVKPAATMPWGLREMWIEGPDGVEIRLVEVPADHPLRRRVEISS